MCSVHRCIISASFAWVAGLACPASGGVVHEGVEVQTWTVWWKMEILGQNIPAARLIRFWSDWWEMEVATYGPQVPQLLFVRGQPSDAEVGGLELKEGFLTGPVSAIEVCPFKGRRFEWFQEKAERLSTEALALPSATLDVADFEFGSYWFIPPDFEDTLPAFSLRPLQSDGMRIFSRSGALAPSILRDAVFSPARVGDENPLRYGGSAWLDGDAVDADFLIRLEHHMRIPTVSKLWMNQ